MSPAAVTRPLARIAAVTTARVLACLALAAVTASPLAAQSGAFGHQVLIDGAEVLVAEPTTSFRPGAVYVYSRSGGAWDESTVLRAPNAERADGFGTMLARTGNTLFVGQRGGPIHVFERSGGGWRATGTIEGDDIAGESPVCRFDGYCGTEFGLSLAAGGDWLMVGVPGVPARRGPRPPDADEEEVTDPRGVVHAYQRDGGRRLGPARRAAARRRHGRRPFRRGSSSSPRTGVLIAAPHWNAGGRRGRTRRPRLSFPHGRRGLGGGRRPWKSTPNRTPISGPRWRRRATGSWSGRRERTTAGARSSLTPGTPVPCGGIPPTDGSPFADGESGDRFGAAVAFAGDDVWVGRAHHARLRNRLGLRVRGRGPTVRCPPRRAASGSPRRSRSRATTSAAWSSRTPGWLRSARPGCTTGPARSTSSSMAAVVGGMGKCS